MSNIKKISIVGNIGNLSPASKTMIVHKNDEGIKAISPSPSVRPTVPLRTTPSTDKNRKPSTDNITGSNMGSNARVNGFLNEKSNRLKRLNDLKKKISLLKKLSRKNKVSHQVVNRTGTGMGTGTGTRNRNNVLGGGRNPNKQTMMRQRKRTDVMKRPHLGGATASLRRMATRNRKLTRRNYVRITINKKRQRESRIKKKRLGKIGGSAVKKELVSKGITKFSSTAPDSVLKNIYVNIQDDFNIIKG